VVPSPLSGDDAHLIGSKSFDGNDFLVFGQEFGFHWRIGHKEEDEE
jgi:hypothetical protein